MTARRAAAALAAIALVAGLAGCAPGLFDPDGTTPETSGSSSSADPSSPVDGGASPGTGNGAPGGEGGDGEGGSTGGGSGVGGTADPQPSELEPEAPEVPLGQVADGPTIVEQGGGLALALDARRGCEPLLGRIVQEPTSWTVQLIVQPECSGERYGAAYPLPGGERPERVVVELGGVRSTLDVP
ncbi:hypothetical protein LG314_10345 [Agrococcus terreus]|uniref:hypothetical protein n=1 Tax=Agrococcus terreus TaxID=574649 RepID=UPI0038509AA1